MALGRKSTPPAQNDRVLVLSGKLIVVGKVVHNLQDTTVAAATANHAALWQGRQRFAKSNQPFTKKKQSTPRKMLCTSLYDLYEGYQRAPG